ncbi:elongation factor Ts [Candidatus Parcubacteria bacterium 4484_255]|nr:MAG: elongation factor Ts [Candidatus Parcubacteria bacterium 4484_255]
MNSEIIKRLRKMTGAGILNCKEALKESNDDLDKAVEFLRKKGQKIADNKRMRTTNEGIVEAYIHSNCKIGVLLELVCETDFAARNEEFKKLAHDIALHIAATNPQWKAREDVPAEIIKKEKQIYKATLKDEKKPKEIIEKIVENKLEKFYSASCLLEQAFVKDDKITIKSLIHAATAKLGENIQVKRFVRFSLQEP